MHNVELPKLRDDEIADYLRQANESPRRRVPKILHAPGDVFNRVVNFMQRDTYMQPHLHPGPEKIEKIYLMRGRAAILLFDDRGTVTKVILLDREGEDYAEVPAFTWHTYVMLTDHTITYETMMGEYDPKSWKNFASWAPQEQTPEAAPYLQSLKDHARLHAG